MTTRDDDGTAVYKLGAPAQRFLATELVCVLIEERCEVRVKETGQWLTNVTRPLPEVDVDNRMGAAGEAASRRFGLA